MPISGLGAAGAASGEWGTVDYRVVVVDDERLAGTTWALVQDGRGDAYLFLSRSAMECDPGACLTRVWNEWEAARSGLILA